MRESPYLERAFEDTLKKNIYIFKLLAAKRTFILPYLLEQFSFTFVRRCVHAYVFKTVMLNYSDTNLQ